MPLSDYFHQNNASYLLENQFQEYMSNVDSMSTFSSIHFNCRSLRKNYGGIFDYIDTLSHNFDVVGLTETWINENEDISIFIPKKYSFVHYGRPMRRGGGVGVLVNENINFFQRSDLSFTCESLEMVFIEIPKKT